MLRFYILKIQTMATQKQIDFAWENAHTIRGKNPNTWRKDNYWNTIRHWSYWTMWQYWWEVDHKFPKAKWWTDNLKNIQALYREKNREKSDLY